MRIYKKDVREVLENLEKKTFGRSFDTSDLFITQRMQNLFTELYIKDSHPAEIKLIKDSYQLLKTKGYYYTDEE